MKPMFDNDEDDSMAEVGALEMLQQLLGRSRRNKSSLSPHEAQIVMIMTSPPEGMGEGIGAEGMHNMASEVDMDSDRRGVEENAIEDLLEQEEE